MQLNTIKPAAGAKRRAIERNFPSEPAVNLITDSAVAILK